MAIACAVMGNSEVAKELATNVEFAFVRVLKLLYSNQREVCLIAGAALAAFSYNNIKEQRQIASQGGVRFPLLLPFIQSESEMERCQVAFQVIRFLRKAVPNNLLTQHFARKLY